METTLTTYSVEQICNGFVYNELEGKGLFGLSGKLVIQPEYQRNYIYIKDGRDAAVIDSLLRGYPLGLIYFNKPDDERLEVLDGQQRITRFGRFVTGKFAITDANGMQQYFSGLPKDQQKKILETEILVYECEGTESEIKQWFKTINIAGVPLNDQELLNAIYSGPFVTAGKAEFSNIDNYMSLHRLDTNIDGVKTYFNTVLDWVGTVFTSVESEMCGLEWGRLYEEHHATAYGPAVVDAAVKKLYADPYVKSRKGIFEYILGGSTDTKLLDVRVFDAAVSRSTYEAQTTAAKKAGESNCPLCALGKDANKTKIWPFADMDADHVTAWSKGGKTIASNCQMLCKTHNRAKGNR